MGRAQCVGALPPSLALPLAPAAGLHVAALLLAKHEATTAAPLQLRLIVFREVLERALHLIVSQIPRETSASLNFRH